jgi:hypothetical protein
MVQSIEIVFDDSNRPEQGLATGVINPSSVFIAVSETAEPLTLDVDGNCGWEMLSGCFGNTVFCVFSHGLNCTMPRCSTSSDCP